MYLLQDELFIRRGFWVQQVLWRSLFRFYSRWGAKKSKTNTSDYKGFVQERLRETSPRQGTKTVKKNKM